MVHVLSRRAKLRNDNTKDFKSQEYATTRNNTRNGPQLSRTFFSARGDVTIRHSFTSALHAAATSIICQGATHAGKCHGSLMVPAPQTALNKLVRVPDSNSSTSSKSFAERVHRFDRQHTCVLEQSRERDRRLGSAILLATSFPFFYR